jgi:hypothetical protein
MMGFNPIQWLIGAGVATAIVASGVAVIYGKGRADQGAKDRPAISQAKGEQKRAVAETGLVQNNTRIERETIIREGRIREVTVAGVAAIEEVSGEAVPFRAGVDAAVRGAILGMRSQTAPAEPGAPPVSGGPGTP